MSEKTHYGRVLQDGIPVASVSSEDRGRMLANLSHYAAVYAQDGPVELQTRSGKSRWRRHVP